MPDHLTIIGGGVAGLTAAIAARQAGLPVTLLERLSEPGDQPGETLHPGMEPLFEELGVAEDVMALSPIRQTGVVTIRDGKKAPVGYGMTDGVPWQGFQIERRALKIILLNRAVRMGAKVVCGCGKLVLENARAPYTIIRENGRKIRTDWLIDASGPSNWLKRFDRVSYHAATSPMAVCYGYESCGNTVAKNAWPEITFGSDGWTWRAPVGTGRLAWVTRSNSKTAFNTLRAKATGSADATWRVSKRPAHKGCFRVGDAAFRMDPSTGKGVLRAVMSSMMAIHLIRTRDKLSMETITPERAYCNWISHWFWSDFNEMKKQGLIVGLAHAPQILRHSLNASK